jgi:hypothetical protein
MNSKSKDPRVEKARNAAQHALGPVATAKIDSESRYPSQRTEAGRNLGPAYLVYFLLVDLLGYRDQGQHEKIAWSVPVAYKGKVFLVEHRKLGLGIFASDAVKDQTEAAELSLLIRKGVRAAQPFFDLLAEEAVKHSHLNVLNRSGRLFRRYIYFRDLYRKKRKQADKRRGETRMKKLKRKGAYSFVVPSVNLDREAQMLAQAAIDAFFSWTEHIVIHFALLSGRIRTAAEVSELSRAEWSDKFKAALDFSDKDAKRLHDTLGEVRRQMRNFVAHGSFGKQGEAFHFHSTAGAVPVLLPHRKGKSKFTLTPGQSFEEEPALVVIEEFIKYLSSGRRRAPWLYAQEAALDTILTMVADGTYQRAMTSAEEMEHFIDYLGRRMDEAIDMDW